MTDTVNENTESRPEVTNYSKLGTDEAMNLVLKAEHDAQQAVTDCNEQAQALLEQARATAHRIAQRSDARITRIHQRCNRIVADEISRIQQDAARQRSSTQATTIDDAITVAAVQNVAELLTRSTTTSNVVELTQDQGRSVPTKKD